MTVAWIAALTAIALLAVGGTILVQSTLSRGLFDTQVLTVAGNQRARSVQLNEAGRGLVTADDQTSRSAALETLRAVLPTFEENHRLLRHGDGSELTGTRSTEIESILSSMDRPHDRVVLAANDLLALEGAGFDEATLDEQRSLATDLIAAENPYRNGLNAAIDTFETQSIDRQSETRRIISSILVATLALLLIEAFLVFRPATRRVRETIAAGREAQEYERARTREQLERMARHDHLTGLANRTQFRERLEHAINAADRSGEKVAVMFLDLDKFKDVNDQYGHDAGDELLIAAAGRIDHCARKTDTVARLGGDEFTLVLEQLDSPDGAANVAQKILDAFAQPFSISGRNVPITTSIGIAVYPDDAQSLDALLRDADSAMYEAKSAGRNTFQFSTAELRASNIRRLQLISDLRHSVGRGDLRLVYQPQVAVSTGQVETLEAFVRWVRPDGTEAVASEFIDVAEDTDLMIPLGLWVMREACRQGAAWGRDDLLADVRVSVNLSERQFREPDLANTILTILNETGMDPHRLEVEVTEDTLVEDVELASATLRLLKGIGVRVVIDDFGTGYSSLSYLKQFPIDALKIDRSFMANVTSPSEDDDDAIVPAAVAGLARHLGIEAIAEGVETEAHLAFVQRIRVDLAQGYYLSPPVPPDDVPALIRRSRIVALDSRDAPTERQA